MDFKFGRYEQRPIKNFGNSNHMRSLGILHISGHEYIGRIARLSLRQPGFLVLQRVSITCYAERCISNNILSDRLSVCPSVTLRYHAKTTQAITMRSSLKDSLARGVAP